MTSHFYSTCTVEHCLIFLGNMESTSGTLYCLTKLNSKYAVEHRYGFRPFSSSPSKVHLVAVRGPCTVA